MQSGSNLTFTALTASLVALQSELLQRRSDPQSTRLRAANLLQENVGSFTSVQELMKSTVADDSLEVDRTFADFFASTTSLFQDPDCIDPEVGASMFSLASVSCNFVFDRNRIAAAPERINSATRVMKALFHWNSLYASSPETSFRDLALFGFEMCISQWYMQWQSRSTRFAHTTTVLSFLKHCCEGRGIEPKFSQIFTSSQFLLPQKQKMEMQAQVLKSPDAGPLLAALREMELSLIDAAFCLKTMEQTGLYDEQLADICCEVIAVHRPVLTSRQMCSLLFSMGVLGHRHSTNQKLFFHSIQETKIDTPQMAQLVMAAAMLYAKSPSLEFSKKLLDGCFLHSFRTEHFTDVHPQKINKDRQQPVGPPRVSLSAPPVDDEVGEEAGIVPPLAESDDDHSATDDPIAFLSKARNLAKQRGGVPMVDSSSPERHMSSSFAPWQTLNRAQVQNTSICLAPMWKWHIDVAHALSVLEIDSPKFFLRTARVARRDIRYFTLLDHLKVLNSIGVYDLRIAQGIVRLNSEGIAQSWGTKAANFLRVVKMKCVEVQQRGELSPAEELGLMATFKRISP